jgi:predicted Ser/Thr protein kinase
LLIVHQSLHGFEQNDAWRAIQQLFPCSPEMPHLQSHRRAPQSGMLQVKDTLRATVNLTFDGRVIKVYHGSNARERFDNEVRVLRHLEARGCNFVPKLLEADPTQSRIVTSNCGSRVEHLDAKRTQELFAELDAYGVHHDDPDVRNVTYRQSDGRFCLIDFEFASILPGFESPPKS